MQADTPEIVLPVGDVNGNEVQRRAAPRSRVLYGVAAVAVAVTLVGLAGAPGKWISPAQRRTNLALSKISMLNVNMLDDGTTLQDVPWSVPATAAETDSDDTGVDSLLDSPGILHVASEPVVEAAEYVFARINQDRYLCAEPAFTYYSVKSAQSQLMGGGVKFFLHLRVQGTLLFDVEVMQLPKFEHAITTSTKREGQVPQLMGDYRLSKVEPEACVNVTIADEDDDGPDEDGDMKWPDGESVKPEGKLPGDTTSSAVKGAADSPGEAGTFNWPTAKGSPTSLTHKRDATPLAHERRQVDSEQETVSFPASLAESAQFARPLGYKPPTKEQMLAVKARTTLLEAKGKMPKEYNAAERYEHCKAFVVKDQKGCGSCYAFAAAGALSARMCANSGGQYNVDISPQQMVSCNGVDGCSGGNAIESYEQMYTAGRVSEWCMPYQGKDVSSGGPKCAADACPNGLEFLAEKDSLGVISDNVEAIQAEILKNGPVFAAFWVYSDFMYYQSGVYKLSDKAKEAGKTGAHAVMMLGWGTDEATGEDYWLLQNSWSDKWGDDGLFKMRRGTDECSIESMGVWFATPKVPQVCGSKACANGAELDKTCKCRCRDGWAGDACDVCTVQCGQGGKLDPRSCRCHCLPGFTGDTCESEVQLLGAVSCEASFDTDAWPALKWNIADEGLLFVPGGYVQIFQRDTVPWSEDKGWAKAESEPVHICGTKEEWEAGKKCPAVGQVSLPQLKAGSYAVYYAKYLGSNEFGVSRGYAQPVQRLWPDITVVEACDAVEQTQVEVKKKIIAEQRAAFDERWKTEAAREAKREARVQEAEAAARVIPAPETARLSCPSVAFGALSVEFSLPAHSETSPPSTKQFGLFPAGQRHQWYELGTVEGTREGIFNADVTGIPAGAYDLGMVALGQVRAAKEVLVAQADLSYQYRYSASTLEVDATWKISPASAVSAKMWVGLFKKGSPNTEVPSPPPITSVFVVPCPLPITSPSPTPCRNGVDAFVCSSLRSNRAVCCIACPQAIDFFMLPDDKSAVTDTGTKTFAVHASNPDETESSAGALAVKPGDVLELRLLQGFDSILSSGVLTWPAS
jgi:cathepsin B